MVSDIRAVTTSTSGTDFVSVWNDMKEAVCSTNRKSSRPTYVTAGGCWVKTVSSVLEQIYFYDGTNDILIAEYNPASHYLSKLGPAITLDASGNPTHANTNTFSASPVIPTPSQFDNTTKAASTAFVKTALGNLSGITQYTNTTTSIAAAKCGQLIILGGSSDTLTLPAANSCPAGSRLTFTAQGGSYTLNRSGSDQIYDLAAQANANSITVTGWETFSLVNLDGSGAWYMDYSTTALKNSTGFNTAFDTRVGTSSALASALAAKPALPTASAGVGNWQSLTFTGVSPSQTSVLPAGGTWAYFGSNNGSGFVGVAAGGTTVWSGGANNFFGFCWRIA